MAATGYPDASQNGTPNPLVVRSLFVHLAIHVDRQIGQPHQRRVEAQQMYFETIAGTHTHSPGSGHARRKSRVSDPHFEVDESSLDNHFDVLFLVEDIDPYAIGIALQSQVDATLLCP